MTTELTLDTLMAFNLERERTEEEWLREASERFGLTIEDLHKTPQQLIAEGKI